ncbi:MAG: class I adenylate-forming enzyme family protein, partial [Acidimicrobiales bacterium]
TGSGVVYDGVGLEGVEVRITLGEVLLRCPMLLRCYRDGTDPKTADGWFATGDAGHIDAAGRLSVHGRLDDLVISGGENIWPAQVEAVLRSHPSVGDVAVGGRADPEWGSRLVAYVVASPAAEGAEPATILAELRELVRDELAPFAAPRELIVVKRLPRSAIGKVQRSELGTLDGPRASAD